MSGQAKLTLLLELKKKLFDNKLMEAKAKLNKTVDSMKGKINQLKVNHLKAFSAMRDESSLFGRAMDLIGNPYALIAAGLLAVGALFAKSTGEAEKFNSSFLQIENLNLDKSKSQIGQYKKQVRDAAFDTGQDLEKSAIAFYDLQSATGLYGNDSVAVFKKVAKYSVATGADLNDSVRATTKAMSAFGLQVKDIDSYLTSNAKVVQAGIVNYAELAQVQTTFGGAAAGAGQSLDTANKIFATFTKLGKNVDEAATMTKTAFQGLTQESTIKGLGSIGIKMYDAKGNMRNLIDVVGEVRDKFKNMTPKQIDELINKIGGPEGLRALFTQLKSNADGFVQTIESFDGSKFDLDKAFNNALGDTTVMKTLMNNRMNILFNDLGQKILPIVYKMIVGIDNALIWIDKHSETIEAVFEGLAIGALSYFTMLKIGSIASTIASFGLSGALGLVQGALHGIKVAIFSIPFVGWIALAITALVIMYKKWDAFRAAVKGLGEVFKMFFSNVWNGVKMIVSSIVDRFSAVGRILKGIFTLNWDEVKAGASDYASAVKKSFEGLKEVVPISNATSHGKEYAKAFKGAYGDEMTRSAAAKKKKEEDEKQQKLLSQNPLGDKDGGLSNYGGGSGNNSTTNDINSVSGNAQASRNITINIDSFVKGGINTTGTIMQKMNAEELERYLNEMFLRIIRNVEMS